MKVRFRRQLGKGGMIKRTTTFSLGVRAELTPEEDALIKKCDAADTVLYTWMAGKKKDIELVMTVKGLVSGRELNCDDFIDLVRTEEEVQKACGIFKQFLEKAKKFGEEEIVDF